MIIGLYVPGESIVHRFSAGPKLIAMFCIGYTMAVVDGPMALATLAMCIAFVFVFIAGLRLQHLWTATRPLVIWIGIIAVAQIGIADAQTAANVILRLLALVWTASIVTYTTRLTDMTAVIARLCEPLRPLGVSPDRVAFLIALTIRLIPAVFDTVRGVREAQRARGLERVYLAGFIPVLTRVLRQSDDLSDALVARGFERWDGS
ncbi:MAG: energy-coupling factor transporter transmembrane protein EcfT [Rhodospirillaceae bacterium]|nr:energy-coupling factor transporter transmembrane protein EcfT [Rhodospirillaceae bacterium]